MQMTSEETHEDFYRNSIKDMIDGIENLDHLICIFYFILPFWPKEAALKDADED